LRLHVHEWGAGDRKALLVHGLLSDHGGWYRVGPALAKRGYHVLAPDLRGHGLSPRGTYSPAEWAGDLVESVPAAPELAIGHSLGGLAVALAVPHLKAAKAVYVDPAWRMTAVQHEVYAEAWRSQLEWSADDLRKENPRWPEGDIAARLASMDRFDPACIDGLAPGGGHDFAPAAAVVPSLVLLADPSDFVPLNHVEELRYNGFTVEVVPGTGHSIFRDDCEGFMAALDEWLAPDRLDFNLTSA
jgi:pimeloyl-ACP methyl ester carboxylesterase